MPELVEVEVYRQAAERALGRPIASVLAPDQWYLKGGLSARAVADALVGRSFAAARRRGKLLLLDVEPAGPVLGLRFGMTGRLLVDTAAAIDHLEYSSLRDEPAWDRFTVVFADGGDLRVRDPRRLGGVELDPDPDRLGPDAARLTLRQLREAVAGRDAPIKATLMDQRRVAGLGNLMVDEALWFAGIDPTRPGHRLGDEEVRALHRAIRRTVDVLTRRGGSHTGDHFPARHRGGRCPRCGTVLDRRTVGGRTTYSCPTHQR